MTATKKSTKDGSDGATGTFSVEERAAMKERAAELRAQKRRGAKQADELSAMLAKIAEMADADRSMAEKLHAVVTAAAPELSAKLWYGMPAWAKNGKLICFFQPAEKFKTRYATFGFDQNAQLDDGDMWPSAFALMTWTAAVEKKITALVKKAAQ